MPAGPETRLPGLGFRPEKYAVFPQQAFAVCTMQGTNYFQPAVTAQVYIAPADEAA